MTSVFIVQHTHKISDENEDVKLIGVYSSREHAELAVSRLQKQPGFRDNPSSFDIDEYQLDKDYWQEGFITT